MYIRPLGIVYALALVSRKDLTDYLRSCSIGQNDLARDRKPRRIARLRARKYISCRTLHPIYSLTQLTTSLA